MAAACARAVPQEPPPNTETVSSRIGGDLHVGEVERPARPRHHVEPIGDAEGQPLRARPGNHGAIVGAKGRRGDDHAGSSGFGRGAQGLLVWGDVLHSHAVHFAHPHASIEFDSDRGAATAARGRMLAQASGEGWWVAGAHLPFPGLGHVRREGEAYAWVPVEFGPLPGAD